MSVAGVFAITDVGDQQQARALPPEGAQRALYYSTVVISARRHLVFALREPEQDDAADPERLHQLALAHQRVDGHLVLVRHGTDRTPHTLTGTDEQRKNELAG